VVEYSKQNIHYIQKNCISASNHWKYNRKQLLQEAVTLIQIHLLRSKPSCINFHKLFELMLKQSMKICVAISAFAVQIL